VAFFEQVEIGRIQAKQRGAVGDPPGLLEPEPVGQFLGRDTSV
jgi:hypothetical protein